jgi:hypothetical protein
VAKMLYATKRARPDTYTAIAFLMTRVWAPNKDNWAKLVHLMKYLRGMHMLLLILSAKQWKWNFEVVGGCRICGPSQQHPRT